MIRLIKKLDAAVPAAVTLTLTLEQRSRSRLRARLEDGREVGVFLPRGEHLENGDRLASEDGLVVQVRCKPERVSMVRCPDPHRLARAAYHLGNRHVAFILREGMLRVPSASG